MAMEPGWYPDPFSSGGYVRWWDGERWGASTTAPTRTVTDPSTPVPLPPPDAEPGQVETVPLATWTSRAVARVIDALIEGALSVPFVFLILGDSIRTFVAGVPTDGSSVPDAVSKAFEADVLAASLPLTMVSVLVTFLYQVPQNVRWGRTVGKRILGIRIRPFAADAPGLTWGSATLRWGTYTAGTLLTNGVFAVVDYLWPLWDKPWRQALHDKAARTIVVPTRGPSA